jgi:hypothetical protein
MRWFKLCQSRAFLNPSTSRSALPSAFVTFWSLGCIKYYTFVRIRFLPHSKHTILHHRYQFGDCCVGKWSVFILWIVRNTVMSSGWGGGAWGFFYVEIYSDPWFEGSRPVSYACLLSSCEERLPATFRHVRLSVRLTVQMEERDLHMSDFREMSFLLFSLSFVHTSRI